MIYLVTSWVSGLSASLPICGIHINSAAFLNKMYVHFKNNGTAGMLTVQHRVFPPRLHTDFLCKVFQRLGTVKQ